MGEFSDFALVPEQGIIPEMAQLSSDMQSRIRALAARLDVRDSAAVFGFGARAQKEMGTFSDIALDQVLRKDVEPLSSVMQELAEQIKACSFAEEAKGFFVRLLGGASSLASVRSAYEKAEPRISSLSDELTDRRVALMRDSALLDRIYDRNEGLYRELCSLIVVGEEAIRQAKARGEEAPILARLERRIEDLRVTQLASTQLAAQIRMVQQSDELTCEKIKTAVDVMIPLWKSQMAAALGLARATDSLGAAQRAQKEAARGVRHGAKSISSQRSAYAKAAQESDRERAVQTADALLRELEEIERDLKKKEMQTV